MSEKEYQEYVKRIEKAYPSGKAKPVSFKLWKRLYGVNKKIEKIFN